jgi:hypothetical protein
LSPSTAFDFLGKLHYVALYNQQHFPTGLFMAVVSETIPTALQAEVNAALEWFNATQSESFAVTGIVDAELSLQSEQPRELRLVLCGGDSCQKQNF